MQSNECEIFQKTDLVKFDDNFAEWKNNKDQAQLKSVDNKEVYLTYKSELGECSDVEFDYIQSFVPSLVEIDGKYMVQVQFTLPNSGGKNYNCT